MAFKAFGIRTYGCIAQGPQARGYMRRLRLGKFAEHTIRFCLLVFVEVTVFGMHSRRGTGQKY